MLNIRNHGRTQQVVQGEALERRARRQAWRALQQAREGDHDRGEAGRGRSCRECPPPERHPFRARAEHAQRQHRARDQTRHWRGGRGDSISTRSSTKAMRPGASRFWWRRRRTTRTAPPPRCGAFSARITATSARAAAFHTCSTKKDGSRCRETRLQEERLFELALEAGAEELTTEEEGYVITTSHDQLYAVAEALRHAGVTTSGQKFTFIPDTTVPVVDEATALQMLRLCESLEDDEDVQNVYSNRRYSRRIAGEIAGLSKLSSGCA